MEHRSNFELMVGNACIQEFTVMADIGRDRDDWTVDAIYADALTIDNKVCTNRFNWITIPVGHPLYVPVMQHFLNDCRDAISERWDRHRWRYAPIPSRLSAGRTQ